MLKKIILICSVVTSSLVTSHTNISFAQVPAPTASYSNVEIGQAQKILANIKPLTVFPLETSYKSSTCSSSYSTESSMALANNCSSTTAEPAGKGCCDKGEEFFYHYLSTAQCVATIFGQTRTFNQPCDSDGCSFDDHNEICKIANQFCLDSCLANAKAELGLAAKLATIKCDIIEACKTMPELCPHSSPTPSPSSTPTASPTSTNSPKPSSTPMYPY